LVIFQKLLEELTVKTWLIPDNLAWGRSNLKMYGTLKPLAGHFYLDKTGSLSYRKHRTLICRTIPNQPRRTQRLRFIGPILGGVLRGG